MKQKVTFLIACTCFLLINSCSDMLSKYLQNHDGAPPYLGDVRITNDAGFSEYPRMVWTGSEYGVAWHDNRDGTREIYFARISSAGVKQCSDVRITNAGGYSWYPSIVWKGTEYGVAWSDYRDGNYEIYFARINSSGVKQGSDTRITNASVGAGYPSLAWTGTEYGVAWSEYRDGNYEIYFARINSSGVKQDSDVRITNATEASSLPYLVWTGTGYGLSWEDERDGNFEIYFARVNAAGVKQSSDVPITNISWSSFDPSLVWTGTEYGVAWEDYSAGNLEIYFARISSAGVKQGPDVRITNASGYSYRPSLVWRGSEYAVAWEDNRYGNYEIYFARLYPDGSKKL